jgi:hypothetical protein
MDVMLLGGCQGACGGIYTFHAATVLCELECFSWCFVCYLVFTVVCHRLPVDDYLEQGVGFTCVLFGNKVSVLVVGLDVWLLVGD